MAWFKVDDGFYTSQKVMRIPRSIRNEAVGAWILIGTWSADKMTDGLIPDWVIADFDVSLEVIDALFDAGLWLATDDGIQYHDWAEYQPTKAQLEAKREETHAKKVAAGKKGAEVRWHKDSKPIAEHSKNIASNSPEPVPVPEPLITKVINNRATRIDSNWNLDTELIGWTKATAPGLNIVTEREKFIDYWLSKAGKDAAKTDWERTWKNWVRSNVERNPKLGQAVSADPNAWMIAKPIELS